MKKLLFLLVLPLALLAIPLWMRPADRQIDGKTDEVLVIVTPHTEMIKHEFARAFEQDYFAKTGRTIKIDYRNMGGTSDIVRYIADRYTAEFRRDWETTQSEPWSDDLAGAFCNDLKNPTPLQKKARTRFLASDTGIGIDLFFGGGTYDHAKQAERGFAIDGNVRKRHPEWFRDEILPQQFGGETIYDREGRFYGSCLSSFGICVNTDRLAEQNLPRPSRWRDLAQPEYFRSVMVGDPTKSGSITKCFEVILQSSFARFPNTPEGNAAAWRDGFAVIRRIVANSRGVADSAGKVTREVAAGNAAAGMSIDFYSFSENEWSAKCFDGKPNILYVTPIGGTAVSPDPIQLLRGAPNRRAAEAFLDFVLSREGQRLWDYRVGTPGGPVKYALRRPPVRKDLYLAHDRAFMADPDYNPYVSGNDFQYNPKWTARYFNLIRVLIRTTMIDVHDELRAAWGAIIAAGGPEKTPMAVQAFDEAMSFIPYPEANVINASLRLSENNTALDIAVRRRQWSEHARDCYRRAEALAKEGK